MFLCTVSDQFWERGINFSISSLNATNFTHSLIKSRQSLSLLFQWSENFGLLMFSFCCSVEHVVTVSGLIALSTHSTGLIFRLPDVPLYLCCSPSYFLHIAFNWICLGKMHRDSWLVKLLSMTLSFVCVCERERIVMIHANFESLAQDREMCILGV